MTNGILAHLDDVGATYGSVVAWSALRKAGIIKSASTMVPCPWYRAVVDHYHEDPTQDLGVHLTLTSEWQTYRWRPLIGPAKGLVDDDGFFHKRPEAVAKFASPEVIEDELCAQIERTLSDGIKPTHLDAHMGTAFLPKFMKVLLKVASRYEIPLPLFKQSDQLWDIVKHDRPDHGIMREILEEGRRLGFPIFDRFRIGFAPEGVSAVDYFSGLLSDCGEGLTWFALHAEALCDSQYFAPHMATARLKEFELFSTPSSACVLPDANIPTLTWQNLEGNS